MVGVVHLDAAHRDTSHPPGRGDEPDRRRLHTACGVLLVQQGFPLEPEDLVVGAEGRDVLRRLPVRRPTDLRERCDPTVVAEAQHQLADVREEPPARRGDLDRSGRGGITSDIEQTREQLAPLALGCTQVGRRDVVHRPLAECLEQRVVAAADITGRLDPHHDLGVARDAGRLTSREESTDGIWRDEQLAVVQIERGCQRDGMVENACCAGPLDRRRDLLGGPDGRAGEPLVLRVGDDHRAVGELDLVAGPSGHDIGRCDHAGRPSVRAENEIADCDLPHRRPAVGRRQRRIECERLTDSRARRDDDQLPRVQSIRQPVEIGETRWYAGHRAVTTRDRLDLVERRLEQLLEPDEVLGGPLLGDVVDRLLRAVYDVVDVGAAAGVTELDYVGAGLDEAAQDGLLIDDLGVVAGAGCGRHGGHQRVHVGRAADALQLPEPLQLGSDGDCVNRLAATVEVDHDVVDE
jgi:hypothetical protein